MTAALDVAYHSRRVRLARLVGAATAAAWAELHNDRTATLDRVVPLVENGQAAAAALVDAYMAAKTETTVKGLDATRYTIEALRRVPAREVYDRPFGALGGQLAAGAEFATALASAQGALDRLVRTDLQLAQTHAARDWMADDDRIVGYRRVLGPGHNCSLCVSASQRTYSRGDLMPIHERCHCTVAPILGTAPLRSEPLTVRVADDEEIGPRLLDDAWAA